jgi:hypothetical protein
MSFMINSQIGLTVITLQIMNFRSLKFKGSILLSIAGWKISSLPTLVLSAGVLHKAKNFLGWAVLVKCNFSMCGSSPP